MKVFFIVIELFLRIKQEKQDFITVEFPLDMISMVKVRMILTIT